ncbi:unnamed protein product [Moneuplotes crassus]|uniref:Uncharacterized protein n=1 Tax=Euplotes crassus TaxID=5936 RepID=A0AAD2D9M4_EUPCR|nr:unnamed protein product [Moneuplotes crassus]
MIKHSDSLDSWIKGVAIATSNDPLEYPNFEFSSKEFDNVPTVIPRFLFHINHQLKSVCEYIKDRDSEERTAALRANVEQRFAETDKTFSQFISQDISKIQEKIEKNCSSIDQLVTKAEQLNQEIQSLGALDFKKMLSGIGTMAISNKKSPRKLMAPSGTKAKPSTQRKDRRRKSTVKHIEHADLSTLLPKSETYVHNGGFKSQKNLGTIEDDESNEDSSKGIRNNERNPSNRSGSLPSFSNVTNLNVEYHKRGEDNIPYSDTTSDDEDGDEPKILSMNMLRKVIKVNINRHIICNDMQKSKNNDQAFLKMFDKIRASISDLEARHEDKFNNVSTESQALEEKILETNQKLRTSKGELRRLINHNIDKISILNTRSIEVEKFNNTTKKKIDEIFEKIKDTRSEAQERAEAVERRVLSKFDKFKDITEQKFNITNNEITKMKNFVLEMVEMMRQETAEKIDTEVAKFTEAFTKIKDELIQKTESILLKNKKSISNIKNRSADYFSKYDTALQYIQRRFDNMNTTFEDYQNNFMQPTKMREGRMHAIQAKLKEQEESRETEFKYFKMILQKLLISFENSILISGNDNEQKSKSVVYSSLFDENSKFYQKHSTPCPDGGNEDSTPSQNTRDKINRTVMSQNSEFLPSLSKRVTTQNFKFAKQRGDLDTLESNTPIQSKLKRLSSTNKQLNVPQTTSPGDKNLHKRILFLKEILEINPHLKENKSMLRDHFNEPIFTPDNEENQSQKNSPRRNNNKTVIVSDSLNLNLESSDVPKTKFMASMLKNNDIKHRRKTKALIRKEFEFDNEASTPSNKEGGSTRRDSTKMQASGDNLSPASPIPTLKMKVQMEKQGSSPFKVDKQTE